jgi:hypothetical protein
MWLQLTRFVTVAQFSAKFGLARRLRIGLAQQIAAYK